MGSLVPIHKGRKVVEEQIFGRGGRKVRVFGIELLDIRFSESTTTKACVEDLRPMISERRQIAERFPVGR